MARIKLQSPNFTLSKRSDGYYDIRWEENGDTRRRSTGTRNPEEAERERARFAQDYTKPKLGPRPSVEALCDAYMKTREDKVANKEGLKYAYAPIKRFLGPLHADTITQSVVDGYISKRRAERPERKGGRYGDKPVSDATINKELRQLRAALNWAWSEKQIERKIAFRIELTSGAVRQEWLTKDEANRLIDASTPHLALFITIALQTAKRREAILSLKWSDVVLHLQGHEYIDFGDDVGNKRKGRTPIAGMTRLIEALKAAKAEAKTEYVIEFRGKPVADVKTAIAAACKRAKLRHISPHILKHTSITWYVQAGKSYEEIAKFANTSKDMIERVYGHHSPQFVAGAAAALAF